jgi:hypothetical protein
MSEITPRLRKLLLGLVAFFVASVLLLGVVVNSPRSFSASPLPLQQAHDARDFRALLVRDWLQAPEPQRTMPTCGIGVPYLDDVNSTGGRLPSFGRLRCNLFFDSLALVPAWMALLLFFTLALGPSAGTQLWWRHALCVPVVAAGLFDIAENAMTGRALDDILQFGLAEATVADVVLASQLKWLLMGVAFAVLAWRALRHAAQDRRWNSAAALCCAVAALALGAGGVLVSPTPIGVGLAAALAGMGVLVWRALRLHPTPPPDSAKRPATPAPRP